MGSKPSERTAFVAVMRASTVSPGRKVTAIGVAGGICGAALVRAATSLAVISRGKPTVMPSGARSQLGWIIGFCMIIAVSEGTIRVLDLALLPILRAPASNPATGQVRKAVCAGGHRADATRRR